MMRLATGGQDHSSRAARIGTDAKLAVQRTMLHAHFEISSERIATAGSHCGETDVADHHVEREMGRVSTSGTLSNRDTFTQDHHNRWDYHLWASQAMHSTAAVLVPMFV